MKAAVVTAFGPPEIAVECKVVPELGPPAADEVTVAVEASPINPSDLLQIGGRHFQGLAVPFIPGGEAAGSVLQKGTGVKSIDVGDRVLLLSGGNWVERRKVKEHEVKRIPGVGPIEQFSALRVAPVTAYALSRLVIDLKPGDWVIQNAANSAVGLLINDFVCEAGGQVVNVVRREAAASTLRGRGLDAVVLEGEDLRQRADEATGGAPIKYGFDAVGGVATLNLSRCLTDSGLIVVYGLLSGLPCQIEPRELIAKGLVVTGFRFKRFFDAQAASVVHDVYDALLNRVIAGARLTAFEAQYPLERVGDALAHAQRTRNGKILLRMRR